jgi:glycosyltransferase involved in cell wall biosynthesis
VEQSDLRNVRFLGHVPQQELPAVYDSHDIYINASRVDNFPGALIEASAAGLPVVSTCAGGIPAIYLDGLNALLVEPGDWEGLANAIDRILQAPELGMKLASHGRTLAESCDWSQVRRSLYGAYERACGHPQEELTVA